MAASGTTQHRCVFWGLRCPSSHFRSSKHYTHRAIFPGSEAKDAIGPQGPEEAQAAVQQVRPASPFLQGLGIKCSMP